MTIISSIPILFLIVGALMYFLSSNPKVQELGRILFAAGAFGLAFAAGGKTITLLK